MFCLKSQRSLSICLFVLTLWGGPLRAETQPTVTGLWQEVDDQGRVGAWFYFSEKNNVYSGRLVRSFPRAGEPQFDRCDRCPGAQKGAKMMGLVIIKGMVRKGLHYEGGTILDPRDG